MSAEFQKIYRQAALPIVGFLGVTALGIAVALYSTVEADARRCIATEEAKDPPPDIEKIENNLLSASPEIPQDILKNMAKDKLKKANDGWKYRRSQYIAQCWSDASLLSSARRFSRL